MDYKLMFAGNEKKIIWDMLSEKEISLNDKIYQDLNEEIDLNKWGAKYSKLYKNWLENDDETIYDINSAINSEAINALKNYNKKSKNKIYYWFDVNRDSNPDYQWKRCPLTNRPLVLVSKEYHNNNRLISEDAPLVFPYKG